MDNFDPTAHLESHPIRMEIFHLDNEVKNKAKSSEGKYAFTRLGENVLTRSVSQGPRALRLRDGEEG
jgi:hypothetical protein